MTHPSNDYRGEEAMTEMEKNTEKVVKNRQAAEEPAALDIPAAQPVRRAQAASAQTTAKKQSAASTGTKPAKPVASAAVKPAQTTKPAQAAARTAKPTQTAKSAAAKKPAAQAEAAKPEKKEAPAKKPLSKKAALRRRKRRNRLIRRSILSVFTVLAVVVFAVYMILFTVFNGPSQTVSDLLVNSLTETSALKFVPNLFFEAEEVEEILARNAIKVPDEPTDTSLVVIDRTPKAENDGEASEEKDIELVEVSGGTYHGYMMIVKDPSRVSLAVCSEDFESDYGKYLDEMARENGAIAAINAGGFEDEGGSGRGGKPLGIVVKDSKVLNAKTSDECDIVIGFDQDDKLIVGDMNAKEAEELGLRDAASFNPILVLNGEPAEVKGSSSGLNPRTAIGQRADGAVLLLVIDGRQVNSLGASLADLIDVMMQFGAVNAANLDGGSSSKMYYQGEFVNDGVALTGSRRLPTAFIVK